MNPPVPNLFLIGAAKGGTTAIAEALRAHPQVCMAKRKEPHFFLFEQRPDFRGPDDAAWLARFVVTDPDEYAGLFSHYRGEPVVGEASVYYLYRPESIERIERGAPGARFIVMLRDPVSRALSGYRHLVRDGRETEPFDRALELEGERIAAGWEYGWHYAAVGRYAEQLRTLFSLVDRARVHIALYEDFRDDRNRVLREISRFLQVSDPGEQRGAQRRVNPSGMPRSRRLHRVLTRPRAILPDRLVDGLGSARLLRELRTRLVERNLRREDGGTGDARGREIARAELAGETERVQRLLGRPVPWS